MIVSKKISRVAAGTLIAFHGVLLANQAFVGAVDVARALRWAVGAFILLALRELNSRTTLTRPRDRSALVSLWLIAALLHGPALVDRFDDASVTNAPTLAALTSSVAVGVVATLAALRLVFRRRAPLGVPPSLRAFLSRSILFVRTRRIGSAFLPRPPPLGQLLTSVSF